MNMKTIKRIAGAAFGIMLFMMPGITAQAVNTEVQVIDPEVQVYVQGGPAAFPSEDGKMLFPVIMYNDSNYMQLRTVGKWMGKNVSWDNATKTVEISGTIEKSYPSAEDEAYKQIGITNVAPSGTAEIARDISVLIDGQRQTFRNQRGETIYPLFFKDSVYLPIRNIGELVGFEVTWYEKQSENDVNAVFLRAPLTEDKQNELDQYATDLLDSLLEMRATMRRYESTFSDVQVGNYLDTVLVERTSAAALVAEIQSQAKEILNEIEDKNPLVEYYNQQIAVELNYLVANADSLIDRIQNGSRIVVGTTDTAFDALDKLDSTAIHYLSDGTMLDAERMVRVVRQNMDVLF